MTLAGCFVHLLHADNCKLVLVVVDFIVVVEGDWEVVEVVFGLGTGSRLVTVFWHGRGKYAVQNACAAG
jgi:hypothetical protein